MITEADILEALKDHLKVFAAVDDIPIAYPGMSINEHRRVHPSRPGETRSKTHLRPKLHPRKVDTRSVYDPCKAIFRGIYTVSCAVPERSEGPEGAALKLARDVADHFRPRNAVPLGLALPQSYRLRIEEVPPITAVHERLPGYLTADADIYYFAYI